MRARFLIFAAVAAPVLCVFAAVSFDVGADLRIRQELMQNVPGMPGGGLLLKDARSDFANHMRFRPRLWAR